MKCIENIEEMTIKKSTKFEKLADVIENALQHHRK
jgi:hypothetical protein